MSTTTSSQIGPAGQLVLALETPPWDSAYRALIGYGIMPAYLQFADGSSAPWKLFAFFLAILAALRIVPGVFRRVLPFSREVKTIWAKRRALARRYDSYQWRKLFGLGLGWLMYLFIAGLGQGTPLALAIACVVGGSLGLLFWHKQSRMIAAQASPPTPASASAG